MKKQKKNLLEDWRTWVIIALAVLLIYFYWSSGNKTNDDEGYKKYCVDSCTSKMGDCAGLSYVVDGSGETWLYGWDFEDCFSELEDCVRNCKK